MNQLNNKNGDLFKTTVLYKKITVQEILEEYLDEERFLKCCKACPNYNTRWSCPPYDFSVTDYWKEYKYLHVFGYKVDFTEKILSRKFPQEELDTFIGDLFKDEMKYFYERTTYLENLHKGSVALAWGKCYLCKECTRSKNKPCRYEKDLRYSIESLGGNVDKLTKNLFHIDLKWAQEGKLPPYYFSIVGLLTKEDEALSRKDF